MASLTTIALLLLPSVSGTPFTHSWDTVRDVLGMHGKFKSIDAYPPKEAIEYVAKNYPFITTGSGCGKSGTIEEGVVNVATQIKAINPKARVGMYYRSDFVMEIADCSGFAQEWKDHPEWYLKDDDGKVIKHGSEFRIDYSNPDAAAFFAKVLFNVTTFLMPNGQPAVDFVYIDGDPSYSKPYDANISPERTQKLVSDEYKCFGSIQSMMDAAGHDGKVIEM
jgi:hypothetical protein